MSTRYLLDTNIISDALRHTNGVVASRIHRVGNEELATSIIVACELRFGVAKKPHPKMTERVQGMMERFKILPFEAPADIIYARTRADLESRGLIIGANDLLIASQAMAVNLILVTDNVREFSRVRGLKIENWLRG